jgi:hypothetical protein
MSDWDESRPEAMSDALSEASGEGRDEMKAEVLAKIEHQLMLHTGQKDIEKVLYVLTYEIKNL